MPSTADSRIPAANSLEAIQRRKQRVAEIRHRVREAFDAGTPGIQIAAAHCEAVDEVIREFLREALELLPTADVRRRVEETSAVIAVGGAGRGELCPYSDVDLLFLDGQSAEFAALTSSVVQFCWDAKLELGHSLRTIRDCIALARQDPEVATSLVEARLIWGSEELLQRFQRVFKKRVVDKRRPAFIRDCLVARLDTGPQAQELEPDVKNSIGGLRDIHLLRWLGFALCGERDIDSLRLHGLLTMDETRRIKAAWEHLTRLRIDLHLHAGRAQDRLTRDEQLRIARERGIQKTREQRGVERLMQEYFHHASELAAVARRFANRHRPRSLVRRTRDFIVGHRAEGVLRVSPDEIDAPARALPRLCRNLESILNIYKAAALYDVRLSPRMSDAVKEAAPRLSSEVTPAAGQLFRDILRCTTPLGPLLRSMADTGLLDRLLPHYTRIRNLMQFNQYHHFTVDEHTLRAVETVTAFEQQQSPVGAAYRNIKHKEVLHFALLLHDIGKGQVRDHCEVGEEIAWEVAPRVGFSQQTTEQIAFLVRFHLEMADIAFRRDISDNQLLLRFSHQVGSPERLRMLFTLTVADVTAVGPGVWTDWKADLLTELFDRCLLILSGKHYSFQEQERLRVVKEQVRELLGVATSEDPGSRIEDSGVLEAAAPPASAELPPAPAPSLNSQLSSLNSATSAPDEASTPSLNHQPSTINSLNSTWLDLHLGSFSAYYLTVTPPERIAADLKVIHTLRPDDIHVSGVWDGATATVDYRVITRNPVAVRGCFHRICGVMTAKRLEIISADINTTHEGVVVDTFRVLDTDFSGPIPDHRIAEVADLIQRVLRQDESIEALFKRSRRFDSDHSLPAVSNLPTRVSIDNESSDSRTVVDVFAHDRPGLLYRIARTLHELEVSIDLAKISTHFDQVVDVFYLTESDGRKITDDARLEQIRTTLLQKLN